MSTNAAVFREWISGDCVYSGPPSWKVRHRNAEMLIVGPGWDAPLILAAALTILALITASAVDSMASLHGIRLVVFGVLPLVILGICDISCAGVLLWSLLERRRGPFLIYSARNQTLVFPRLASSVDRRDLLGWRRVAGNWVGREGEQKKLDDPVMELQAIVRTINGPVAVAVLGGVGDDPAMDRPVEEIARETRVALEIVVQRQGLTRVHQNNAGRASWRWGMP